LALRADTAVNPQLDTLYRRHAPWLRERLSRRYGHALADDLVQEAYLRLPAEAVRFPKALLLRTAVNLAIDHFRAMGRARRRDRQAAQMTHGDLALGQDASCPADQESAVLLAEIALKLEPLYRDVFLLSRGANLTYVEIAQRLKIPTKTVEWRMGEALKMCAALMREEA
jgi:RNA polymerase sigma-70 factor (ECF subfamily)